jgi:hypothetical protein
MKYFDRDLKLVGRILQKLYKEKVYGKLKERRVYNYLNRYMNAAEKNEFSLDKINKPIQSDVVWVCWLQGLENAPQLVKACIASIKRHVSKKVILITADNFAEFVNIPEHILQKWKDGKISKTHFSDVLRISLLSLYGGCWIDSTVYLMDTVPQFMRSNPLFCFNISKYGAEFKIACSWWISSEERQPIIVETRNVLYEYWKHENRQIDYFLFHKIFKKIIERQDEYKAVWNTKPYVETGHTHILRRYLNDPFDSNKLNEIKSLCVVQKLSYKMKFADQPNTFFNYYVMGNNEYND